MVKRTELDMILKIADEIKSFNDFDFWVTAEEHFRLKAFGIKAKADIGDSIVLYLLENDKYTQKNVKQCLEELKRLKERLKRTHFRFY